MHNGAAFGPSMYIDVTVSNAPVTSFDLRVITPLNIPVANLEVNHFTTATFTVKNYGTTTASLSGLTIGGRGPGGDYDIQDFPWMNGISIAPGQSYTYQGSRSFSTDGRYRFFPVARTWNGQYLVLNGPNGEAITATLRVSGLPLVFAKSISVLYQGSADEAVDVITYFPRPQADGSYIVNVRIVNKTKLALALYFHDLGSPTYDPHGDLDVPYAIVWPTNDPVNGGLILRDVTFKPDSDLNMVFSAYGTETHLGGDGSILWLINAATLFCIYQTNDVCPTNALDIGTTVSQEILEKMGTNLQTLSETYGVSEGLIKQDDPFKLLSSFKTVFEAHPEWLVWVASKTGLKGVTTEAVKGFLGAWTVKFFLAYPKFLQFSWDFGRSRWLGVFEVRLLPTLKPNPYLFPSGVSELVAESDLADEKPALPGKQSDGPSFAQIQALLTAEPIELTTIRASSSAFGPGWEYFRMNDGDYASGWTNGGDLAAASEWVTFEIGDGRPVRLQQVLIHPGPTGGDDASLALKDFAIEYSYDGWHYSTLFTDSFSASEVGNAKVFTINPVLAHQIRLRAISNQGGTSTAKFSVAEIAVAGNYVAEEDAFEPDDTVEDATLLAIDQSVGHVINHEDDWDCHNIQLVAGVNYTLQTHSLGNQIDTVMNLYGLDGAMITGDDDSGGARSSKISYSPEKSGLHVLCVYQFGRTASGPEYTYQVLVKQNPSDDWYGEYYNNDHFEGNPVLTRRDSAIDFEWYDGSPDPAILVDHFSIRWARVVNLQAGLYTFYISRDDGMQVWIDGERIYGKWDVAREYEDVTIYLDRGTHLIQIDSYENDGWAQAKFSWNVIPYQESFLPMIIR